MSVAETIVYKKAFRSGTKGSLLCIALSALMVAAQASAEKSVSATCACFSMTARKGKPAVAFPTPLVDGTRISSRFGVREHPLLGTREMHWGIDIAARSGTPTYATGDGIIEEARRKGSYGYYILLRHSKTISSAYAHISRFASGVHPGLHVTRGSVIGYVGSTGRSTGPHLHYEVFVRGGRIRPLCDCTRPALNRRR